MTSLLVAGGSGELGSRSVAWCQSNLPDIVCVSGSRTAPSTGDSIRLNIHDTRKLTDVLKDFDIFLNAVGPYDYDPTNIIKACNTARCHYTDLAELPEYLHKVKHVSDQMECPRIAIIPGCSTTPGLVNVLSGYFSEFSDLDCLEAWLSIGTRNPTSHGLVYGLLRPMGRELADGQLCFSKIHRNEGRLYGRYPFPATSHLRRVDGSDVEVKFFVGFDSRLAVRCFRATSKLWSMLTDRSLGVASKFLSITGNIFRLFGKEKGILELLVKDRSDRVLSRLEVVAERNGLSVPCQPPLWLVEEHEFTGALKPGFWGLEDVITPQSAIRWLRRSGCKIRLNGEDLF